MLQIYKAKFAKSQVNKYIFKFELCFIAKLEKKKKRSDFYDKLEKVISNLVNYFFLIFHAIFFHLRLKK